MNALSRYRFVWNSAVAALLVSALALFSNVIAAEISKSGAAADHWAYKKPVRPNLPEVMKTEWARNPIDRFIPARLEKEKLSPSSEADAAILLRRLSLDLTGLPPTLEEIEKFGKAATSPDEWEKAIDYYLGSPHYGEKWARQWLDLARYADSHGYEKDPGRQMWLYRDWVINALNKNMPFDQFTIEQIAGDLLPNATVNQKIASGFHRNTMFNTEGGVDKEEARMETIVDRVNTTATVWLGTTLACAQCHNHKYDPFTNKEYYQFMAYFNNVDEPELDVPSPDQAKKRAELKSSIERLEKIYATQTPELEAAQASWEYKIAAEAPRWSVIKPSSSLSAGGATLKNLEDDSLLASGPNPNNDSYTIVANTESKKITGFRLEVYPDDSLPKKSLGRHENGSFVISKFEAQIAPKGKPKEAKKVVFKAAAADYTQNGHSAGNLIDDKDNAGWAADAGKEDMRGERYVLFQPESPLEFSNGATITFTIKNDSKFPEANIGRFRLSLTESAKPIPSELVPGATLKILAVAPITRNDEQKNKLSAYYRSVAPALKETRDQLASDKKAFDTLKKEIPITLVMTERTEKPRETFIHIRGNFMNKGDKVTAAIPAALGSLGAGETNRLALAKWLVSKDNPLTARVEVNRIWAQYFGHGLVETEEDFGTQGSAPTHPELLDWLAVEFMEKGWDLKAIHKLIVTSATWRQSSKVTPELIERDPANHLYARAPRFRVPAEVVRDIALQASGLLKSKIGGPSVYPYQPDGIWTQIYGDEKWNISGADGKYRRGLYTYWKRTSPYPAFMSFDAPSREVCTARRPRTNTPLQALTTLNDPAYVEAAQVLARRIVSNSEPDPAKRIAYGFKRCLTRNPNAKETERLVKLYNEEKERYAKDMTAAEKMAFGESGKVPEGLDPVELAAWTVVANVLLNLDETISKS